VGKVAAPAWVTADGGDRAAAPVWAMTGGEGKVMVPAEATTGTGESGPVLGRGGTTSQGRNCDRGRSWYARLPFGRIRQLGGVPAGEAFASGPPYV